MERKRGFGAVVSDDRDDFFESGVCAVLDKVSQENGS
jgi:hypothetical protein